MHRSSASLRKSNRTSKGQNSKYHSDTLITSATKVVTKKNEMAKQEQQQKKKSQQAGQNKLLEKAKALQLLVN